MAVSSSNIVPAKFMETSQTTQYTSINAVTMIDKCTVTNETGSNVTFSINLVPNGSSASNANRTLSTTTVAPNECYLCPEIVGQTLNSGDFISTLAGTGSALSLRISGRIIT